ncbi:pilus assembly protein PilY, partial [Gardnerella vaginalis]
AIFTDQVYKAASGSNTPAFVGTAPSRKDYVFTGWTPTVADKVTANVTYVAQWKRIQRTVTFKDGNKTHA